MATRGARTVDKTINDKHARILKALLHKPENKFCVDCRRKVKSIDLDSWTAEQVENMIKWGNEKANKYWEARLPASSIPNENTSGIDPWIRSKYEWKLFASQGPVPDPAVLGPVDEAMLADLGTYGTSVGARIIRDHCASTVNSNPLIRSQVNHEVTSGPAAPQENFFGLNEPAPDSSTIPATTQNQTQANNKRASVPLQPHQQQQNSTAAQDLFSLNASPATPAPSGHVANAASPVQQAKTGGNADWKNSIMSLYGNQNSAGNRTSTGLSIGQQQQQQQQQRPQSGQFNQVQGVNSFGYGQLPPQQYQQQQHHQQQQYPQQQHQHQHQLSLWGTNNNNGLGNVQQAAPSFGSGYNNGNGFGGQTQSSTNSRPMSGNFGQNSNNQQGGDFFDMIANATKSPVSSPPTQNNKSSSAFGDLSWK
ncbi:hypothetical protein BGX30_012842 [Mortierella sp. GBA39]|nr:hypothetical protein BGX30_012842 [Mortierella sp. GBA39]